MKNHTSPLASSTSKAWALASLLILILPIFAHSSSRPNVILIMADDLGWGDTGYNGNKVIKTPHLDLMSMEGIRFDRFYSASAVCSPTRASVLTGRSPYRTGVPTANSGILRPEEITLPEILQKHGYATGHFGKWHLGTLTHKERDSNRGRPGNTREFNPPKIHGYDTAFVTEAKVPTYDPMKKPEIFDQEESLKMGWAPLTPGEAWKPYGTSYWDIDGNKATENLDGDNSRVVMDRVLPFIDKAEKADKPFLAVIWFHTPHLPCVAGPRHQKMYEKHPLTLRNYAGCITAMDEQIGRLRAHLSQRGLEPNTMIWFCSDNGPEGARDVPTNGTAGPYRGRKRSLYEGGVRVPGLLVWPAGIARPGKTDTACFTSDYLPTVLDAIGINHPKPDYPLDGTSLMPLIKGKKLVREQGPAFMIRKSLSWMSGPYKLISTTGGKTFHLFNLTDDPGESFDLAMDQTNLVQTMSKALRQWHDSVKSSFEGAEYGTESIRRMKQKWPAPLSSPTEQSKKGER